MRWLPLPTCRLPLRRFIASLTITSLLLPMFGAPVAYADGGGEEMAPPVTGGAGAAPAQAPAADDNSKDDGSLCSGIPEGWDRDNKAENTEKFRKWRKFLEQKTKEHNKPSPDTVKDAMIEQIRKANGNLGALEDAVGKQEQYLSMTAEGADHVCRAIVLYKAKVKAAQLKVEAANAKQTSETCSFEDFQKITNEANQNLQTIREALDKFTGKMRQVYGVYAHNNQEAVKQTADKANLVPTNLHSGAFDRAQNLTTEYQNLWGNEAEVKKAVEGKIREGKTNSFFGLVLRQIEEQSQRVTTSTTHLTSYNDRMKSLMNSGCKSFAPSTISGQTQRPPTGGGDGTRVTSSGQTICTPGANGVVDASTLSLSQCGNTTSASGLSGAGDPSPTRQPTGGSQTGGSETPPANPSPPPPPAKAEEEESWFSRNKTPLIIGGVGVAAVAGALYWKKTEDDKSKDKAKTMELEAMAAAQTQQQANASSSSSGSSTSTDSTYGGISAANQTTVGSTLMIEGTPSGSVAANSTLPKLTIKVVDPNGIMTTDSSTDITVSCASATPSPCTLSGTLTVNTDKGSAVFSDLKFTGAHTNVTLLFSAGGFTPVKSGNFDVTSRQ